MSMSIGCVGCGNMGGAILAGLAASSLDCTLYGHTRTAARMAPLEAAGVTRLDSARELARKARSGDVRAKDEISQIITRGLLNESLL